MDILELLGKLGRPVTPQKKKVERVNVVRADVRAVAGSTSKALLINQIAFLQSVSRTGWVKASAAKLCQLAQLDCSDRTVRRLLQQLEAADLLISKRPEKTWDREYLYRVNHEKMARLIEIERGIAHAENQAFEPIEQVCPMEATPCPMDQTQCQMETSLVSHVLKEHKDIKEQQDTEPAAPAVVSFEDESSKTAVAELQGIGVAAPVAAKLVKDHGPQACLQQLEWLPLRSKAKNPAALLVKAISQRWEAPAAAVAEAKTQETAATSSALARFLSVLSSGSVLVSVESGKRYVVERVDQLKGYAQAVLEGTRQDVMICDKNYTKVAIFA